MTIEERFAELFARLEEYRKAHDREHVLMERALEKADKVQEDVDHKLNNVRQRFVDRDAYDSERNAMNGRINAALIGLVLLLIGVIADIALRGA